MAFREPRTPGSKTPGGRRNTMDVSNVPRNSFAPTSSSAAMRRSSSVFNANFNASTAFKDKRNLLAMPTKIAMIKRVVDFCNGEFTEAEVKQPTRRTFLAMFEYIYSVLHDHYGLPKAQDDQNAEIIKVFKNLGYPVPIKNSTLVSLGAPNSWPHLLGALTWMIELSDFYTAIQLEKFLTSSDCETAGLRYQNDSLISKKFFDVKKDHMSEKEKDILMHEIIDEYVEIYKKNLAEWKDVETAIRENELRMDELDKEIAALEQEKESDRCPMLSDEIKAIDLDIKNLDEFLEGLKTNEDALRKSSEHERREINELDMKIAELTAVIKAKQNQIEQQTQRTGLNSADIRALAMEKESLKEQLKQIMSELEKLSKIRYNLAPKATTAFIQEQSKFRRLVQRVYDVRAAHLEDTATPIIDSIPTDIKALLECLSTDVRRLFSRTKTELETRLHDLEASTRCLAEDERRLHDDDARVEKENRAEEIGMEKEDRARQMEREDWEREANLKEREKQSAEVEKDTILGSHKEAGHLNRLINEAQLDLDEAGKECERKKNVFDSKLEERVMAQLEIHENVIQPRQRFIENEMDKLDEFNKERAKKV